MMIMTLSNAKDLIGTYEPYCRILAIFSTPHTVGLAAIFMLPNVMEL